MHNLEPNVYVSDADIAEITSAVLDKLLTKKYSWELTRSWKPRVCKHTKKSLWLRHAYHVTVNGNLGIIELKDSYWLSKSEGFIEMLKKS